MKYREKEWLEEQIKIHGANGRQIALANNYSPVTVQRYMKKFNLYEKKEIKNGFKNSLIYMKQFQKFLNRQDILEHALQDMQLDLIYIKENILEKMLIQLMKIILKK